MLDRVVAIALNTYREALRARILLGLAGVAFAMAFYSLVVGAYTLRSAARVVSDLGIASISVFSIAVAIVIGSTSLHRELEQKTLFPILARPIRRGEYLVGKFLGTMLTIAVFVAADAGLVLLLSAALATGTSAGLILRSVLRIVLLAVALPVAMWRSVWARTYGPIPWAALMLIAGVILAGVAPEERRVVLGGSGLALLEVSIVASFGLLFSSFSTPFLSALLTVGVIAIGRNADMLARLPVKYFGSLGPFVSEGGKVLARVVPNLYVYVPPRPLLTGEAAGAPLDAYFGMATTAALGWTIGLLAVAAFIFRKRDFL